MTKGPTTSNGPLDEAMLADRSITASFADLAAARAARDALIAAGIDGDRVDLADQTGIDSAPPQADPGLFGRIRDMALPDDGETALRSAIHHDETILTLRPLPAEVERAVTILAAASPSHFDADLERWRNAG